MPRRLGTAIGLSASAAALAALVMGAAAPGSDAAPRASRPASKAVQTSAAVAAAEPRLGQVVAKKGKSPIKHVVVIFDENISYDHYFGTYPEATNKGGTRFRAKKDTPKNDNLITSKNLKKNKNLYKPFRLAPTQPVTCDQNHGYGAEQKAFNSGVMDQFVQNVSVDTCPSPLVGAPGLTMGYFDGNTVTGLWNYAQNFALSDNFYGSNFGPSTPGAINLISGNTHGFTQADANTGVQVVPPPGLISPDAAGVGSMIGDPQPFFDDCSSHSPGNALTKATGRNVGDLLNAKGVSWGWFQGGFAPTVPSVAGSLAACGTTHANVAGGSSTDYIPHHNPFSYYASTANPHHLPPTSISVVGTSADQANHNYDLSVFAQAVQAKKLPSVSFLKASAYQDGHAGYSDPIDEQHFLVDQINLIQKSKYWKDTAIVVAYDDSDGWYDHKAARTTNGSADPANDQPMCSGVPAAGGYNGRCGPGPRLPLLVISPYAKANYVDHHQTEQASILRFIEDNWKLGRIGDFSFDTRGGSISHMFDFKHRRSIQLLLKPTGAVKKLKGE